MDNRNYDDILHLARPVSPKHPPMPVRDRAAQFSPFAALSGYEAAVQESARLTERKNELDEETKSRLNEKLQILRDAAAEHPAAEFLYFQADAKKAGGTYVRVSGRVKQVDAFARTVSLDDGTVIPIEDISGIESALFRGLE
ncbi:MAG: YolD-like family protein [Ruminococcaceae bacterium]|nr:YolD-like family protein [Oscillospiraceae bacterium]